MFLSILLRAAKYIIKGIPYTHITAEVTTKEAGSSLKGKHVLITGGSKGIGFAIAQKCIKEGAIVLICSRNIENLEIAQQKLGGDALCKILKYDVSYLDEIEVFMSKCYEVLDGNIDCFVNNAGISFHEKDFRSVTVEGFEKQFSVNYKGPYFLAQKYLLEQENRNKLSQTNLLFISSERGSFCTDIPYGLTKAVINSLIGGLNYRIARFGGRVNAIAPGVTVSDMTGRTTEDLSYAQSPIGRVLLPEEIAEVAAFLLSDYSQCISGEVINCDSGAHLKCI